MPVVTETARGGRPSREERRGRWAVLGALMLAMLLAALDQTIVSTALPTIVLPRRVRWYMC